MTPEKDAEAKVLHDAGMPDTQIAKRLQVNRKTVQIWRKLHGLEAHGPRKSWSVDEARRLYDEGLLDAEIGARLGVTRPNIAQWRWADGLPSHAVPLHLRNAAGKRPYTPRDKRRFEELYERGKRDVEIAALTGCNSSVVWDWREKHGLPSHGQKGDPIVYPPTRAVRTVAAWSDPLWARAARAIGPYLSPDIAADATSNLVLAVLEGEVQEDQMEALAWRMKRRTMAECFSWRNRSIDEDLTSDGFTLGHLLQDVAALDAVEAAGERAWAQRISA